MSLLSYKYYDTPEGQDIYKKVFVTSKYAAVAGLSASIFDVLLFSHPKGILATVGRFVWITGPLVGMASAFTVTTNFSQNIRGKNDMVNYFLGGVASGAVFSAWQRTPVAAVPLALALGFAGIVKKAGIDEGWTFWPDVKLMKENATSVRNDWTFVKDLEHQKGWTTGTK